MLLPRALALRGPGLLGEQLGAGGGERAFQLIDFGVDGEGSVFNLKALQYFHFPLLPSTLSFLFLLSFSALVSSPFPSSL